MNAKYLTLALCVVFSLAGCGSTPSSGTDGGSGGGTGGGTGGGSSSNDAGNTGGGTGGGTGSTDSGTGGGTGHDAGTMGTMDAGTTVVDAGGFTGSIDAGTLASATAVSIAAGRHHSCAVTNNGHIRCWGANEYGQLGIGTMNNDVALTPVEVPGITAASTISSFNDHTCATVSGSVKCWGYNAHGELGNGGNDNSGTPVDVAGFNASTISVGYSHACAITTGGGLKCWGENNSGQLGDNSNDTSNVPVDVMGLTSGVKAVAAGTSFTCAVTTAGAVMCWGANSFGQLGNTDVSSTSLVPVQVMTLSTGASFVATGQSHTCAATSTGLSCWGSDEHGEIGNGSGGSGTNDVTNPVALTAFTATPKAVATGYNFSCAVTSTNGVKCWGDTLGAFPSSITKSPTDVPGLNGLSSNTATIVAGLGHVCALSSAGAVKCWGDNDGNQLGNGTQDDSATPVSVLTLP